MRKISTAVILIITLISLSAGSLTKASAQGKTSKTSVLGLTETVTLGLAQAINRAIDNHKVKSADNYYYKLIDIVERGEWGLGKAEKVKKTSPEVIPSDFSMILCRKDDSGDWEVVLPDQQDAYLGLLSIFPEALLGDTTKEYIRDAYDYSALTLYSNHYLPWMNGSSAFVYQNYSAHGEGQLDFGFTGDIRTTKAGSLYFAYDSHTWSRCTGKSFSWCNSNYPNAWYYNNTVVLKHADGEYSSYLHLLTDSIPTDIINNCNNGIGGACTGVNIPAGTVIGKVGSTGLSLGTHLHYGTGDYPYGRCNYPDVYDEDGDGNTTETNICTGGITGGHGISVNFYEKPYFAPNCGTGAGQNATLCMLYYPRNTNLFSQNPGNAFTPVNEEFSSASLNSAWHWYQEDPTHWSLIASPGYLQIITQSKDIWASGNTAPLLLQFLPVNTSDSFVIQTGVVITPTVDFHQAGLIIYADYDNYVRFTYAHIGGPTFELVEEVAGNPQAIQVPAPVGINDFHLRIAKRGTSYSAYYSQDGVNWTWIGTHQNVNISPNEAGLLAFNGVDWETIEIPADFDYFRLFTENYTFGDVNPSHWAWKYVEGLYEAGVTSGCSSSPVLYCPTGTLTRDQMAVFLLKAKYGSGYMPPDPVGMFLDVPVSSPYARWIEKLAQDGITSGCGGGNYCPTTPVTRDQMAVFLVTTFGLPTP